MTGPRTILLLRRSGIRKNSVSSGSSVGILANSATVLLLAVAAATVSGCRLFDAGVFVDNDRSEDRVLSALRAQLRKDAWRENAEWSLIRATESEAAVKETAGRCCWNYDRRLATALIGRLDKSPEYPQPIAKRPWRAADKHLLKIAHADNLAGWNALILLGQRAPEFALPLERRLRELVENPLRYDAETGERVTSALVSAAKPEGPGRKESSSAGSRTSPPVLSTLSVEQLVDLAGEEQTPANGGPDRSLWEDVLATLPSTKSTAAAKEPRTTRTVSTAMRRAAAEAWCRVLAVSKRDSVDGLAPAGRALQRGHVPDGVRRELTLGIARHVPPAMVPGVAEASQGSGTKPTSGQDDTATQLRRTAVEACVVHATVAFRSGVAGGGAQRSPPPKRPPGGG
jgi:hypothetical protein